MRKPLAERLPQLWHRLYEPIELWHRLYEPIKL